MNKVVGGDLPAEIWRDFLTRAAPLLAKDKRQAPAAQGGQRRSGGTRPRPPQRTTSCAGCRR